MTMGLLSLLRNRGTRQLIKKLVIDIGVGIIIGVIRKRQQRMLDGESKRLFLRMQPGTRDSWDIEPEEEMRSKDTTNQNSEKRESWNRKRNNRRNYVWRAINKLHGNSSETKPIREMGLPHSESFHDGPESGEPED